MLLEETQIHFLKNILTQSVDTLMTKVWAELSQPLTEAEQDTEQVLKLEIQVSRIIFGFQGGEVKSGSWKEVRNMTTEGLTRKGELILDAKDIVILWAKVKALAT